MLYTLEGVTPARVASSLGLMRRSAQICRKRAATASLTGIFHHLKEKDKIFYAIAGLKDYTEIIYTAHSAMKIGAYQTAAKQQLFFESASRELVPLKIDLLDPLINCIKEAKKQLK